MQARDRGDTVTEPAFSGAVGEETQAWLAGHTAAAHHRLGADSCPACGKILDAATGGQKPPEPGSLTVCGGCFVRLEFDQQLRLKELSAEDLAALPDVADTLNEIRTHVIAISVTAAT